ncbi:methyltransferase domain-containing protein [Lysobacter sp. K5869]|uniref:class I SAM-dependent methyltransferase n=1 Tax=Lysobacter sp. K5869 TaxID=2820808 RepID=UPI001C063D19|nr:class I SAM-dependent methyltransferase [Lysobacter sp. K5869]QWP79126.1 methyltransferase domain-containing protein [Lysobacter sp. K5869]
MNVPAPAAPPNAEQIDYWNGPVGQRWLTYNDWLDERTAAYGRAAFEAAAPQPGEAVLDIGCGAGATSFELARAVGASGAVTGVDISAPLLGRARERAAAQGLAVEFREADASRPGFAPQSFDLLFSRFGVMFFDDPTAAFAELRKTLKPGGRLAFACWQGPELNDWYERPLAAIAHILERTPVDTRQPGPFAFSDPDHIREVLTDAGFAGVELKPFATPFYLGRGATREAMADDAMEQVFRVGPIARLLEPQSEEINARARAAIRASLLELAGDDRLEVGGAVWVVTARAG